VLALDPELVLAGGVAGVVADLKGGDDDGADGPGFGCLGLETKATANAKDAQGRKGAPRRDMEDSGAHGLLLRVAEVWSV
jgi:hypothetical protein